MTKPVLCQLCHTNEAIWAMQYVAELAPSFYTLGSHIRGFGVIKICDACKDRRQANKPLPQPAA